MKFQGCSYSPLGTFPFFSGSAKYGMWPPSWIWWSPYSPAWESAGSNEDLVTDQIDDADFWCGWLHVLEHRHLPFGSLFEFYELPQRKL